MTKQGPWDTTAKEAADMDAWAEETLPAPGTNGHDPHATNHYSWNAPGNAQRLLDAGGRYRLRYVPKQLFPWHMWNGNCWPQDTVLAVDKWMERILKDAWKAVWQNGQPRAVQTDEAKYLLRAGDLVGPALTAASRHVAVEPSVFDTHIWYLP
jgi:hypothetical protein